jgi:GT2 family glycosyltransferase
MRVSVIIPTYKRAAHLEKCLGSLLKQKLPPDQVIVVTVADDSPSHLVVDKLINSGNSGCFIQESRIDRLNIVYAENQGLKSAFGEIVCFIDDDAFAPDDWISSIVRRYEEDPKTGGVGGPVLPFIDGKPVLEYTDVFGRMNWYGRRESNSTKILPRLEEVDLLRGANMSFRRSLIGSFDENLLAYWRRFEDDICLSIKDKGYRIVCDPQIKVWHSQSNENRKDTVDQTPETIIGLHHNSLYVKLKHIKGLKKIICVIFELIWGDDTAPGCLLMIMYGIKHGKPRKLTESIYALTGKLKGICTYLKIPAKGEKCLF